MEENLYTAGVFAKKAGVSIRTIRFYDKENLLKPSSYSEAGYRLYTDEDFARLQKILTLKFLGFSLSEIKDTFNHDQVSFKSSLEIQKEIIYNKINHMNLVAKAISEAEKMVREDEKLNWDKVINIISVINTEKDILHQYRNSTNLAKRINIHDKYSANKTSWHRWVFNKLKLSSHTKVLEIGCGNAMLWHKNMQYIPQNTEIILTDISEGMLEDAKCNLQEDREKFKFKRVDANNITFSDESFDIVIANHVLFYCSDRERVLSEIRRVLKPGGYFYCSTIGETHMKELEELVQKFNKAFVLSEVNLSSEFGLENGESQLSSWFQDIKRYEYEDYLVVTERQPLLEYVYSTHGNIDNLLKDRHKQFEEYIKKELSKTGKIFISKCSGLFESRKL